ncbi:hypothetical protein CO701_05555 [Citrobacter werkmanii]|nr:hypothetical protein CO701_05555 [Citrobacter werkmanii]
MPNNDFSHIYRHDLLVIIEFNVTVPITFNITGRTLEIIMISVTSFQYHLDITFVNAITLAILSGHQYKYQYRE